MLQLGRRVSLGSAAAAPSRPSKLSNTSSSFDTAAVLSMTATAAPSSRGSARRAVCSAQKLAKKTNFKNSLGFSVSHSYRTRGSDPGNRGWAAGPPPDTAPRAPTNSQPVAGFQYTVIYNAYYFLLIAIRTSTHMIVFWTPSSLARCLSSHGRVGAPRE